MACRFLLLFPVAALCACCGQHADPSAPVRLAADDAGRMVELKAGREVSVSLSSNPTTGFSWTFTCAPDSVLILLGEPEYKPDHPNSKLVGSGGTETFRFRGALAGMATLRFDYRRPWEKDSAPARSLTFTIRVVP